MSHNYSPFSLQEAEHIQALEWEADALGQSVLTQQALVGSYASLQETLHDSSMHEAKAISAQDAWNLEN